MGKREAAEIELSKAVKYAPVNIDYRFRHIESLQILGQYKKMIDNIQVLLYCHRDKNVELMNILDSKHLILMLIVHPRNIFQN